MSETDTTVPVKKNKGGRPRKTAAPAAATFSEDQFQQLIGVLSANKGSGTDLDALKEILATTAQTSADAMKRSLKPENETHPGKSCFSYAEGDVAKPRPVLPFEFLYNSYPVHKFPETEHWRELELAAQVTPGTFTVIRKDGSKMSVLVDGERDADGKLTRVSVSFPVSREEKWLVPPKSVVLYQLVNPDHPRRRFVEAMQEHFALVMGVDEPVTA